MKLKCLVVGHDWTNCSSLQSKGPPGKRKDVLEVAKRCRRCDKFVFIRDDPYVEGVTKR